MSSRVPHVRVLLAVTFFLAAGAWTALRLPAQDAPKEPPAGKQQKPDDNDGDPKAAPAKSNPAEPAVPPGGKKRNEEQEDPIRAPRKVIRVGDEDAPAKPLNANPAAGVDLATAAKQATNRYVIRLYQSLAVPYDSFTFAGPPPRIERVVPVPIYVADKSPAWWKNGGLMIQPLDAENNPSTKPHNPGSSSLRTVKHYEQIAMDAVDEFLRDRAKDTGPDALPREQLLGAAETVLAAAMRFHDSARLTGARKGSDWDDAVRSPLKNRLLDIQLEQLRALSSAEQWDPAFNLAVVLLKEHKGAAEQQRIAQPLIELLNKSFNKGITSGEGIPQAFRQLRELEDQFPDKSVFKPISEGLHKHAERLRALSKEYVDQKNPEKALEAIAQAVQLAPDWTDLRLDQRGLMQQHRILRVGVSSLPVFLSPALATTDSELQGVELLFESLVKLKVDVTGSARYVPALAEDQPRIEALTRVFSLPYNARWSNGHELTAFDIRATVDWGRRDKGNGLPTYWAPLLHEVVVGGNPYRVKLSLTQGYFEPLSLTSFKVLPANEPFDSEEFARNPIGSGPYRLDKTTVEEAGHKCVSFVFNPLFGARHGKEGLPHIREVRLFESEAYDSRKDNSTDEFERMATAAPLDMILGLTPAHAASIARRESTVGVHVLRANESHWPNRRIYFLAVNNQVPTLSEKEVRRALAHAINREALLDEFFRQKVDPGTTPILGRLHVALNGPYPAGSWACDPKVGEPKVPGSLDLFDEVRAKSIPISTSRKVPFQLKYPAEDLAAKGAMEALCRQLSSLTEFQAEAVPVDGRQLRKDVETGNYELAYYHYDFADETYPLWPLMAGRSSQGGLNIFRAQPTDELESLFQTARVYRDFSQIKETTRRIHDKLDENMPFIPLWQLDPLIAVHKSVAVPPFDPVLIFNDIENWRADAR